MITIENGIATSTRELFYTDIAYYDIESGNVCGDLGFEFGEKADTINDNSLEENIKLAIEGCKSLYIDGDVDSEESIAIYEICKATFTQTEMVDEDEEVSEDDFPLWAYHIGNEYEVMFRIAICTKEEAEKHNLEEKVGKIDYYIQDNI